VLWRVAFSPGQKVIPLDFRPMSHLCLHCLKRSSTFKILNKKTRWALIIYACPSEFCAFSPQNSEICPRDGLSKRVGQLAKSKNNSAFCWPIVSKFGTLVQYGSPQAAIVKIHFQSNTKLQKGHTFELPRKFSNFAKKLKWNEMKMKSAMI